MFKGKFIDLSHRLIPDKEEYHLRLKTVEVDDYHTREKTVNSDVKYVVEDGFWYILQDIEMSSHCGTHIEFPYHHNKYGEDAASFGFDRLIAPCVLLDFRYKKPNEAVTLDDLLKFDDLIQVGDSVLLNFGVDKNYRTEKSHDRPYLDMEAVKWLADIKKINIIGSDASGIEIKGVPNQPVHQYLMEREIPIIEFANNLDALTESRFMLIVLALAVEGLDSCPVRLVAYEEG
jgi:arylformamidase